MGNGVGKVEEEEGEEVEEGEGALTVVGCRETVHRTANARILSQKQIAL